MHTNKLPTVVAYSVVKPKSSPKLRNNYLLHLYTLLYSFRVSHQNAAGLLLLRFPRSGFDDPVNEDKVYLHLTSSVFAKMPQTDLSILCMSILKKDKLFYTQVVL